MAISIRKYMLKFIIYLICWVVQKSQYQLEFQLCYFKVIEVQSLQLFIFFFL